MRHSCCGRFLQCEIIGKREGAKKVKVKHLGDSLDESRGGAGT